MALRRDLRVLLTGQALSWAGDAFQGVALPVAVAVSGGSTTQLATVVTAQQLTRLVFMLAGGVAADRFSPRLQMMASDAVRLAAAAFLAWLFWSGHWSTAGLTAAAVASAVAGSFFMPAVQVVRTSLTDPADRQRVNALVTTIRTSVGVGAPVVGGAVVAAASPAAGFAVNAATYVASLVAVLLVRHDPVPRPGGSTMLADLREGVAAVRERRWLVVGLACASAYHLATGVLLVLMPLLVVRDLGGARAYGLVSGAEAAGALVGALAAMRHRVRYPLRWGYAALALMALWPLSYAWPRTLPAVMATSVVGYAGLMYFDTHWGTAVQSVPERLLGRVSAVDMTVSFAVLPLGSALSPLVTRLLGTQVTVVACAAWLLAASVAPLLDRSVTEVTTPA